MRVIWYRAMHACYPTNHILEMTFMLKHVRAWSSGFFGRDCLTSAVSANWGLEGKGTQSYQMWWFWQSWWIVVACILNYLLSWRDLFNLKRLALHYGRVGYEWVNRKFHRISISGIRCPHSSLLGTEGGLEQSQLFSIRATVLSCFFRFLIGDSPDSVSDFWNIV